MATIREKLRDEVERLTEQEAEEALRIIRSLYHRRDLAPILRRLAGDPTFIVPENIGRPFHKVTPAKGTGRPASELLVEDRR